MAKPYAHLELRERTLIYWWLKEDLSLREIGKRLNRSHTTISRELKRNPWFAQGWFPRGAQEIYRYRMRQRAQRYCLKNEKIRRFVRDKLRIG